MKKIFLALLVAFVSTAAVWAEEEPTHRGTGCGTMEDPYSGRWGLTEFTKVVKQGDYIAPDCHLYFQHDDEPETIMNMNFIDDKICGYVDDILHGWEEWTVGDCIDDTPFDRYQEYARLNPERSADLLVVSFVKTYKHRLYLTGHYTGRYSGTDDLENDYFLELYSILNKAPKEYDVTRKEELFISKRLVELRNAQNNNERYAVLEKTTGEMRNFLWNEFCEEINTASMGIVNEYFTKKYDSYKKSLQSAKDDKDLDEMARIVAIGRHVLLSAIDCYKQGYAEGQEMQYIAPTEPGKRMRIKTSNDLIFEFNFKDIESVEYYRATK